MISKEKYLLTEGGRIDLIRIINLLLSLPSDKLSLLNTTVYCGSQISFSGASSLSSLAANSGMPVALRDVILGLLGQRNSKFDEGLDRSLLTLERPILGSWVSIELKARLPYLYLLNEG